MRDDQLRAHLATLLRDAGRRMEEAHRAVERASAELAGIELRARRAEERRARAQQLLARVAASLPDSPSRDGR